MRLSSLILALTLLAAPAYARSTMHTNGVSTTGYIEAVSATGGWIATQAEAEAGVLNDHIMTPLRVKQAITAGASNKTITTVTLNSASNTFNLPANITSLKLRGTATPAANATVGVQLGTGSGTITSGYEGGGTSGFASGIGAYGSTTNIILTGHLTVVAGSVLVINIDLDRIPGSNIWYFTSGMANGGAQRYTSVGSGRVNIANPLTTFTISAGATLTGSLDVITE